MDPPTSIHLPNFAANENEAEAGRRATAAILNETDRLDANGPFWRHCIDNALIWKLYMDQANISDNNLSNILNSDLDPLLIFAGLFSAILSAFLIDIRKGLQEDLQNTTNTLLTILIEIQLNLTGPQIPSTPHFEPSSVSRWINGLWFSSLMFSLMSALGASLAKGWVTQFSSAVSGSSWGNASIHYRRFMGIKRWHLKLIIQCLPILIHIAFFLFSAGLIILLLRDDFAIGVVLSALTALIAVFYFGSTIHPVCSSDSPFRTPVSGMIRRLLTDSWAPSLSTEFPSRKDAFKAQALAWLMTESPDADVIKETILAIAGLPATPHVQNELLSSSVIDILSRDLSEGMKDQLHTDRLKSCLYALLHLVQTAPADADDMTVRTPLQAMVEPRGALFSTDSLPPGIKEIALCVKARILLLICDHQSETSLFDTDIPVLLKSSPHSHIQHILLEVYLLSRDSTAPYSENFLAMLRDSNAGRRNDGHKKLMDAATLELHRNNSVSMFGIRTILEGLTAGSSDLRRRYGELFSELVNYRKFRLQIVMSGTGQDICSLLRSEDKVVRQQIISALTRMAADDTTTSVIYSQRGLDDSQVKLRKHNDIRTTLAMPDNISQFVALLGDTDKDVRKAATEGLVRLAQHDNIRATLAMPKNISQFVALLGDTDRDVRNAGTEGLLGLAQNNDIRATLAMPDNIKQFIALLGNTDKDVQADATKGLVRLAQYDDIRAILAMSDNISQFMALLGNMDKDLRAAATEGLLGLAQHDDIRATLVMPDNISRFVALLGDTDNNVQVAATKGLVGLAQHNDICAILAIRNNISRFVALLGNTDNNVRVAATKGLVELAQHDDICAILAMPDIISRFVALLGDTDRDVRNAATEGLLGLAQHDKIRATLAMPDNISQFVALFGNMYKDVRKAATEGLVGLAQHNDIRATLAMRDGPFIALLRDTDRKVQKAAIKGLVELAHHDDIRCTLAMRDNISQFIALLGNTDKDVRAAATSGLVRLAQHDDIRAILANNISQFVALLGDTNWYVRVVATKGLVELAQYDDIRATLAMSDHIRRLIALLDKDLRAAATEGLVRLAQHDDIRATLAMPDNISRLIALLGDTDRKVQIAATEGLVRLAQHGDIRATLAMPDNISQFVALLGDMDNNVRVAATKGLVGLAQHGEIRASIATPETITQLSAMLRDNDSDVQNAASNALVEFAQNADTRAIVVTRDVLVDILRALDSASNEMRIAPIVGALIASHHNMSSFGGILLSEILEQLVQVAPAPRKLRIKILMMLPSSSIVISSHHVDQLAAILTNPDPRVVDADVEILQWFAINDQFRHYVLHPERWKHFMDLLSNLLQRHDTGVTALKMLKALVKYDDTRQAIVQSSGIVYVLLTMLKRGTTDIDLWRIGIEGLLVLDLF